jgi:hypothetical protein
MTGRGIGGCRSRCGSKHSGWSCRRGQNYTGARTAAKSGLYVALSNNVFKYGHRAAADQMRTSWEKLVQFVGTNYGQDISNEQQNKIPVMLTKPVHTPEVLARYQKSLDFRLDSGSYWLDGVNGILMQQEPNSPKQDYWNWRAIASLANTLFTVVEPVQMPLLSSMLLLQL